MIENSLSSHNSSSALIENRYQLLQSLDRSQAKAIEEQTGAIFQFSSDVETIDAELGHGAFGEVRVGLDEQERKYVGIKVIQGKEAVAESQQEARLQKALKGKPNIMPLYHFVQVSDELLYQIMPLAGLGSVGKLKSELAKLNDMKLKERILLHIARGLLIGTWAMHKEQIYHLDQKPGNLVIDAEGQVYIIDFGCAVKSESGKICVPQTKGDHDYLAPERWLAEEEATETAQNNPHAFCSGEKVDLWSAGITLLELLTNQNPFCQEPMEKALLGGQAALECYVKETLEAIPELQNPDEQSLGGLIKNLLEFEPAKRFSALQALNSPVLTENPDIHHPQVMQIAISYLKIFVKNSRFKDLITTEKKSNYQSRDYSHENKLKARRDNKVSEALLRKTEETPLPNLEKLEARNSFTSSLVIATVPILSAMSETTPSATIASSQLSATDEVTIQQAIQQLCQPFTKRPDIFDQLKLYIPLKGSFSKTGSDPFELESQLKATLEKTHKVLLLLADGGSGKSLQVQKLTLELAAIYQKQIQNLTTNNMTNPNNNNKPWLPIYLALATLPNPKRLLPEIQKQYHLTEQQLQYLLQNHRILLIGDGYDEQKDWVNLYLENKLYHYEQVKLLITCRPSALPASYASYFLPYEPGKPTGFYDEIYVQPFTPEKIDRYVNHYFQRNEKRLRTEIAENLWREDWGKLETYLKAIEDIAGLKELIKTPLMCRLTLEALPELSQQLPQSQTQKIERAQVYEAFMQRWIKQHIAEKHLKVTAEQAFELGQQLALEMFKDKVASIALGKFRFKFDESYGKFIPQPHRWQALFNETTLAQRSSLPLQETGQNHYKFIHFSIQEFLLARHLYQQLIQAPSFQDLDWNQLILTKDMKERPLLYFLGNFANQDKSFEQALFNLVNQTKRDKGQSRAGANAITVLNASSVPLWNKDFAGISIPEADLSGAILWGSNLEGNDLSEVNFQGSRLIKANFRGSHLKKVRFGEWPAIEVKRSVECCIFSPDGQQLAVASSKVIELYDVETRQLIRRFEGHTSGVNSVSFNGAGDKLASGSQDKSVRLWDVASGKVLQVLEGHTDIVRSVSFNGSGDKLASGSYDNTVRLWDVGSGKILQVLEGHTDRVWSVSFNGAGDKLASGSGDKSVRLWDVGSGKVLQVLEGHTDYVLSVSFNGSGDKLASGSWDKTVRLWDVGSGKALQVLEGHTNYVSSVSFNGSGDKLASGSQDKTVRLWDVGSGKVLQVLEGHTNDVRSVSFNGTGDKLASGSEDKSVRLWDVGSGKTLQVLEGHTNNVYSVSFNGSGDKLASGSQDKTVRLWDVGSGKVLQVLEGHTDYVLSVSFNGSGDKLASGSWDKTVRLWDVGSGKVLQVLEGHTSDVTSVSFNGSGDKLASGSDDKTVRLWDVGSGKVLQVLEGHTHYVMSVSFNGVGDKLASGSWDESVRLWDVGSGKVLQVLEGHTNWVTSVSFNGTGDKLASGSEDQSVRLWDVGSGKVLQVLEGHTNYVSSVSFNGSGDKLASGSGDKSVRLWDVASGRCLGVESFPQDVYSVAWKSIQNQEYLAVGFGKDIACFEVNMVSEQIQLKLRWLATSAAMLLLTDANIESVQGLSENNLALMQQRGAKGTPQQDSQNTLQIEALLSPLSFVANMGANTQSSSTESSSSRNQNENQTANNQTETEKITDNDYSPRLV